MPRAERTARRGILDAETGGRMIAGVGVDLVEVSRLERTLAAAHGARFLERVFTPGERADCEARSAARLESYAARFAAKEAVMKALGTGWGADAGWLDVEVVRAASGAPSIELGGAAAATAARLGIRSFHLSLSHAGGCAIAFVVAER